MDKKLKNRTGMQSDESKKNKNGGDRPRSDLHGSHWKSNRQTSSHERDDSSKGADRNTPLRNNRTLFNITLSLPGRQKPRSIRGFFFRCWLVSTNNLIKLNQLLINILCSIFLKNRNKPHK